jgi:hypothetical protein
MLTDRGPGLQARRRARPGAAAATSGLVCQAGPQARAARRPQPEAALTRKARALQPPTGRPGRGRRPGLAASDDRGRGAPARRRVQRIIEYWPGTVPLSDSES